MSSSKCLAALFVAIGWSGLFMDYSGFKFPKAWFRSFPVPLVSLPDSNVQAQPFGPGWYDEWQAGEPHPLDFSFFEELPWMRKFFTQNELRWSGRSLWAFMRRYWSLPFLCWCLYYVVLRLGERAMRHRPALQVKPLLVLWNVCLALSSALGAAKVLPQVLYAVYRNGLAFSLCRCSAAPGSFFNGPSGFWWSLFIFSKFVELFDTMFLVVRKRPVQPLHHLHHGLTMCAMWSSGAWEDPVSMFPVGMNYCVHALMYTYFAVAAASGPPSWGVVITLVQVVQMLVGSLGFSYHFVLLHTVPYCAGGYTATWSGMLYYTIFFFWFSHMGYERWFGKRRNEGKKIQN
jgi:elongation of very long chain fatty acids protein 6